MVNQTVKLFTFAVLLLIPSVVFALPGAHDPVTGGQGFTCNSCHIAGKTIGNRDATYDTNVCLTCHAPIAGTKTKKQFMANDFANLSPTTVPQASPIQSSHKWFGSDTVPAAGAKAPSDPNGIGLNKAGYTGYVSCGRCHNVHGTSGADSLVAPYLRVSNDTDAMCRNCHAPRDVKQHTLGSHPVNVSYTSARSKELKAAGTLLAEPLVNATNPTGQVRLVNSKILCSTCHGVHTTDSNSATFDAFTTGHTINTTLTKSSGSLLRVDARGAAANDLNVCTNCHTKKYAHNGNGLTPMQCNDCHSGHVEYDPKAAAGSPEATPNVYLVRRYLDYSAAGRPSGRIIYNSTTTKNFYSPAGGGVCQSCHAVPAATHLNADKSVITSRTNCTDCHKHDAAMPQGSFTAAGGCTTCHGYPPVSVATSAAGYTRDEATLPHSSHASGGVNYKFTCDQCHNGANGSGTNHNDGVFNDGVFVTKVAITSGGVIAGSTAAYATGTTNCSNVYCHSDGTSTTATLGSPKTVTWLNGLAQTLTCASCHAAVPTTGAHTYHVTTIASKGYTCKTCHADTATSSTTVDVAGGKHVNAVKDVRFTDATLVLSGSSCSTVYCHSNGKGVYNTPTWAAGSATNGRCNTCHATAESTTVLATGTHTTHLTAAIAGNTNATSCAKCHTYTTEISATHIDGTIQAGTGCSTSACHGSITAPTWGVNTTNDSCTKCHGTATATGVITAAANNRYLVAPSDATATDAGKVSTSAKTGAHQTHLQYFNKFSNYSTVDFRCATCHTLPTTGAAHVDSTSAPVFTRLAIKGGAVPTFNATAATCSNVYCHNPKAGLTVADAGTAMVPAWNDPTYVADNTKSVANCQKCHLVPGSVGFTKQSAHGTMTTDATVNQCSGCHGHDGNNIGAKGQRHLDGIMYANGSCDSCHGYPPVASMTGLGIAGNFANAKIQDYANGGGQHTLHLSKTVLATEGFTPCLPCHPDSSAGFHHNVSSTVAQANVNVNTATGDATDLMYRFDSSRARRYNATARTCSNVSCHFQPTAAW